MSNVLPVGLSGTAWFPYQSMLPSLEMNLLFLEH